MISGLWQGSIAAVMALGMVFAPGMASAAQLSSDGKAAIPKDVQQLIVVDYRAMQNSPAAMSLKDRVLPPELKRLETALKNVRPEGRSGCGCAGVCGVPSGRWDRHEDCRDCAGSVSHPRDPGELCQDRRPSRWCSATTACIRWAPAGMGVAFLNQTTMVFGDRDAVKAALDARDGMTPNFLLERRHGERDGSGGQPRRVEPAGPEGHADDDEERAGRGGAVWRTMTRCGTG